MTKPTITIFDASTDQTIQREMTDAEFAQWEIDKAIDNARKEAEAQKATEKAALLDQLGITADQAKLLMS